MFAKLNVLFSVGLALCVIGSASAKVPTAVPKDVPFNFVAYGDTRSNPAMHRKIIQEIIGLKPEFVMQSGDLVLRGYRPDEWPEFDAITKPLRDHHIPYYPARGNHDVGPYYIHEVRQPYDSGNGYYYAFTRHHNRFIIVDSMDPDLFVPTSTQYKWLRNELAKAQYTANNMFVMFHEGPYSVGPHGPTPDAQTWLCPLFNAYKPRLVICGHDHLYYRTKRNGVTYVITGGGGAELYQPTNAQLAIPGDVYKSVHHVINLHVDGSRVTGTVITPDGVVIDKFTLGPK